MTLAHFLLRTRREVSSLQHGRGSSPEPGHAGPDPSLPASNTVSDQFLLFVSHRDGGTSLQQPELRHIPTITNVSGQVRECSCDDLWTVTITGNHLSVFVLLCILEASYFSLTLPRSLCACQGL